MHQGCLQALIGKSCSKRSAASHPACRDPLQRVITRPRPQAELCGNCCIARNSQQASQGQSGGSTRRATETGPLTEMGCGVPSQPSSDGYAIWPLSLYQNG